ncbi:MAG: TMEM14 family protein [Cyanobacteria bacterium P01_A01_bin.40]
MNIVAISATIAYGLLAGLGGIWGYLKSRSKPSLISGCLSGVLLLLSAAMQIQGANLGLLASRIIVLLLLVVFGIRLTKTGKFMPSGIMLITGVIVLSCLFVP